MRSFAIVVNASGCGSHLKERGLPALDVTEALRDSDLPGLHPLELTVAYQDSCHLRHAQRLPAAWKPLLERIVRIEASPMTGHKLEQSFERRSIRELET